MLLLEDHNPESLDSTLIKEPSEPNQGLQDYLSIICRCVWLRLELISAGCSPPEIDLNSPVLRGNEIKWRFFEKKSLVIAHVSPLEYNSIHKLFLTELLKFPRFANRNFNLKAKAKIDVFDCCDTSWLLVTFFFYNYYHKLHVKQKSVDI